MCEREYFAGLSFQSFIFTKSFAHRADLLLPALGLPAYDPALKQAVFQLVISDMGKILQKACSGGTFAYSKLLISSLSYT